MSLKLYYMAISPPCRAVLLTIRYLKLDVELKHVNLLQGEHSTPEFLKLNPARKVPVLVDGNFVLTQSRAIMTYLANLHKPGSYFYPSDPKQRAVIDERLYFDAIEVFERNAVAIRSVYVGDPTSIPQTVKDNIVQSMTVLDSLLANSLWFAGDTVTLADLSILSNVSQIKACGYNISQHSNLSKWLERCETLPGFEENQKGADEVGDFFKSKIPSGF